MRTGLRQIADRVLALVRRLWPPAVSPTPSRRAAQQGVAPEVEPPTANAAGLRPDGLPTVGLDDDSSETVASYPQASVPDPLSSEAAGVTQAASAQPGIQIEPDAPAAVHDDRCDGSLPGVSAPPVPSTEPEPPQPPDTSNERRDDHLDDLDRDRLVLAPVAVTMPVGPTPAPTESAPALAQPAPAPAEPPLGPGKRQATRSAGDKRTTPPRDIEGRRRTGTSVPATRKTRQYTPPPELTVRQAGAIWEVVLVAASDDYQLEEVTHGGAPLPASHRECSIPSLTGSLTVAFGRDKPLELPLAGDRPMVFKLGIDWSGTGRRVSAITLGHFIVIAPRDWSRTGRVPVEPEDCTDSGFHAHYFYRERGDTTDVGGFNEYGPPLTRAAAVLDGNTIFDDSNEGDLFGGPEAPKLTAPGAVWARVGEEGKKGWGKNFKLNEPLNKVLGGRQGRFFLRVYDGESKLLDSCEFRYLRSLREICINGDPYTNDGILAPAATGHAPVDVRFVSIGGALRFNPTMHSTRTVVEGGDHVLVDPHPDADSVSCTLASEGGSVDVVLDLPRIWWRMERDGEGGDLWVDRPIELARGEFAKHATQDAAIRVRLPRTIRSAFVGFDDDLQRRYRTSGEDGGHYVHLRVPLTDFAFHPEILEALAEDVSLNLERNGTRLALVRVPRDPSPEIVSFICEPPTVESGEPVTLAWETLNAMAVVVEPNVGVVAKTGSVVIRPRSTTAYTLKLTGPGSAEVTKTITVTVTPVTMVIPVCSDGAPVAYVQRGCGGRRRGKGFSRGEVKAAGVSTRHAMTCQLRIDGRRRTTHPANVAAIRRSIDV